MTTWYFTIFGGTYMARAASLKEARMDVITLALKAARLKEDEKEALRLAKFILSLKELSPYATVSELTVAAKILSRPLPGDDEMTKERREMYRDILLLGVDVTVTTLNVQDSLDLWSRFAIRLFQLESPDAWTFQRKFKRLCKK